MTERQKREISKRLQTLLIKMHPNLMTYKDIALRDCILNELYYCIKCTYNDKHKLVRESLRTVTAYIKLGRSIGYISDRFFEELDLELSKIKALTVNANACQPWQQSAV